jgi:hypothetical protein
VPTITVDRVIAADPTSVALLLGGPALGLCPPRLHVRALPPRRLPTSYVTRFSARGRDVPATEGTVTLTRHASYVVAAATLATITLTYEPAARAAAPLRALAAGFLDDLAAAAEDRSSAA